MSEEKKIIVYRINEDKETFHLNSGNYLKISLLGEGSFGVVFLVKNENQSLSENSNIFALKINKKYQVNSEKNKNRGKTKRILPTDIKELTAFKKISEINNPNLAKLLDYDINEENEIMILMEYFPTELKTFFTQNINVLDENFLKNITLQILSGLNALNKKKIIHCDIKPENILYNPSTNIAQITDFGLSRTFNYDINRNYGFTGGTLPYMAPEILLESPYFFTSIDIWSLGCMLVEFYTGKMIFGGNDCESVLQKIEEIFGPIKNCFPEYEDLARKKNIHLEEKEGKGLINFMKENQKMKFVNKEFYDFMNKILVIDPVKRLNARNAIEHKWLSNKKN